MWTGSIQYFVNVACVRILNVLWCYPLRITYLFYMNNWKSRTSVGNYTDRIRRIGSIISEKAPLIQIIVTSLCGYVMDVVTLWIPLALHHSIANYRKLDCLFYTLLRVTAKKSQRVGITDLVEKNYRWHKGPVMRKAFPCHDIVMESDGSSYGDIDVWYVLAQVKGVFQRPLYTTNAKKGGHSTKWPTMKHMNILGQVDS